ncbi:MAG: NAD(P)/FAD-dependent oxidoreductase [Methanomassiliicoccales archaeon]|jgi:geranylgeranyl reductase family protein
MDADIVVAGAGPVGTTFAALVAGDAEVIVLEEHQRIGRPVQCTGLVAPRVVELADAESVVISRLRSVTFHLPGGGTIDLHGDGLKAVVVDRARFDELCAERAIRKGARIVTGERLVDFKVREDSVDVHSHRSTIEKLIKAKLVVGADGYRSTVASAADIKGSRSYVRGLQMDVEKRLDDQERVHVFVGQKVAPGFFAWEIPCGDFTRVGVCVSTGHAAPSTYLKRLLSRLDLKEEKVVSSASGIIPIGPPSRTYADRVMIVGDAAGQAKPLSGGGIYTGMVAARCAAETATEALDDGKFRASDLSTYQARWKKEIGKELERGWVLRRAYLSLSDEKLDEIGGILSKPKVLNLLSDGDIDFPSSLAPKVVKAAPSLLKFAPQFIRSVVWH